MTSYAPWEAARPIRLTRVVWVLGGLMLLFLGRVLAQLIQWSASTSLLPSFDRWQSGALPYGVLLGFQLLILGGQVLVVHRVGTGSLHFSPTILRLLRGLGWLYLVSMVTRLALGLLVLDGHDWFDAPLPSVFHIVLAGFVLVAAYFGTTELGAGR